jgi:RND family efflux transporter MFP subunit
MREPLLDGRWRKETDLKPISDETPETNVRKAQPVSPRQPGPGRPIIPIVIALGVVALLVAGGLMVVHADAQTSTTALAASAKPVTVVESKSAAYRASRTYIGTIDPWVEAKIGPQLVSAYVDTVLVRPGDVVRKGDVIATLDCRNASAAAQGVAMQARALEAEQQAISHEATRVQGLLEGGFVSPNEAEQKTAQSASQQAQLLAQKARLLGTALEVNDCILRSPFDGEVSLRTVDPGAFVRPGTSLVTIVDRRTVRVTADAPEVDFDVVPTGTRVSIHVPATGKDLVATVSRRAPAADPGTRTVHFELDVPDPDRSIPVGTTAELRIEVGEPAAATAIPLYAATVRGTQASLFVIEGDAVRKRVVAVKGELRGLLYCDPELKPGTQVVSEGRALLNDKDKVTATLERVTPALPTASEPKGGKP